jgi:pimeloyl-ACP methyl ester carboxylesterase
MPETQINGERHFYDDLGDGPVLVLVHTAGASAQLFADVTDALSRHFRIVAPDLRGLGRSAHVKEMPPTAWNDDLMALLEHLGIDRFHLLGSALGARIAVRAAIDHPDRVLSLVADAPYFELSPEGVADGVTLFGSLAKGIPAGGLPPAFIDRLKEFHGADWQEVMANYPVLRMTPGLQEYYNLRDDIEKITCPVMIMRGDIDDAPHPLMHAVEMHLRLPETSRLWVAPNALASAILSHPDEWTRHVLDFLSSAVQRSDPARVP